MLDQIVSNRWFARADLLLVISSGLLWIFRPEIGALPIVIIALIPWAVRILAGSIPFRGTLYDWLIVIFLVTAWVGYWAAYDRESAWRKVWFIVLAVLLYYALSTQPRENWFGLCLLSFGIGVGTSGYLLLTHDFLVIPRKLEMVNLIGRWLMSVRPQTGWSSIHPNYVAGIASIMTPFIVYPAVVTGNRGDVKGKSLFYTIILFGLGIVFFALFMATSRGVVLAIISGLGVWVVWQVANIHGIRRRFKRETLFPAAVIVYLFLIIGFLYAGPANLGDANRADLFSRSLYLLWDFPITGGGLGSFPGLYSQYLLVIPFFNLPNSHNLFLDVAIETGIFGGLAFSLMYLASIWLISRSLTIEQPMHRKSLNWILLFSLIIAIVHGMVDNYLFNGVGTLLSLLLVALTVLFIQGHDLKLFTKIKPNPGVLGIGLILIAFLSVILYKNILSTWYANLGSVRMARVELDGFPSNSWDETYQLSMLGGAETALLSSLRFDPDNRTANQRLGLISMSRYDFESASKYMEMAYKTAPNHRGIIKSLGYCYVWLGDMDKAQSLLAKIPEAKNELNTYIWWWGTQGRDDLAGRASKMISDMESSSSQK